MGKRWLLNLALLLVAGALVLLAVFEPGRAPAPEPVLLSSMQPDEVRSIRIEYDERAPVIMQKSGAAWRMIEPYAVAAGAYRIDQLLRITRAKSYAQLTPGDSDLQRFDLDPPRARLTLNETVFAFGGTEPINNRRYVQTVTDVHLLTDRFYHHVAAGAEAWVDRSLLGPDARPESISLPGLSLHKGADGWQAMAGKVISMDAVNTLIDNWRSAQAMEVRPLPEEYGNEGVIRIELEGTDAPLTFTILATEPDLVLGREDVGLSWHLPAAFAHKLLTADTGEEATAPVAETE